MFKCLNCGSLGHDVPFDQNVSLASEFGFGGVDIDLGFAREKGAAAVKELLETNGLRPGAFGLNVDWRDNNTDRQYAESLEGLVGDCRLAAEIGSTRCTTWVMPCSDVLTYQTHFDMVVRRLRPAAEILKGFGQSLGLEFIGPRTLRVSQKHGFVYTMDGMRAVGAAIGTGNVGFLLDSYHWYTAQATVSDIEDLEASEVVCVHLNDAPAGIAVNEQLDGVRELPGTGVIDLEGFFGALEKIGYDGPVTVEPFNEPLRKMAVRDAVKATSAAMDSVHSFRTEEYA